jgi:hypothetical protein
MKTALLIYMAVMITGVLARLDAIHETLKQILETIK